MNATQDQEAPELRLREQRQDSSGEAYTAEWYCDVPAAGLKFTVVREEWNSDYTVRKILQVRRAA